MGTSIHTELEQQTRILDDLDAGVDNTSGRLNAVVRRVNKLLESTSGTCYFYYSSLLFYYRHFLFFTYNLVIYYLFIYYLLIHYWLIHYLLIYCLFVYY
jgi:hypothetical protein